LPSPLLPGRVKDQLDERFAGFGVLVAKDVARDFDEIAIEPALVPAGEDVVELVDRQSAHAAEEVVALADELHVAVLDAVVDHLDVMARAFVADPVAARRAIGGLGSDRLKDRLEVRPRCGIAAGHDRRPLEGALLAAGHTRADVEEALRLEV